MVLSLVFSAAALWAPVSASAQDMDITLAGLCASRTTTMPETCLDPSGGPSPELRDDWYRVMTQFAGALIPPVLAPAGTRGVRGLYIGFETWLNPIENGDGAPADAWARATEGDGMGGRPNRFVDPLLAWGRFNVRKGLPFGFDLGMNIGYMANSSYWTLGLEIRWALFEGFREDVGWIPDLAVRGAVQTLLADAEFNVTVPSVDIVLSEPFVIANTVEVTPSIYGQVAFIFADSELVDLSPNRPVFESCVPDPNTPTASSGSPPYCTDPANGAVELSQNVVFPRIRSTRFRLGGGLNIRYEWFMLSGSFMFDVVRPSDMDGDLPTDLPRQMQINIGAGVSL